MNTSGLGSLLWFLALGVFFYFMMRRGGCGGGHDRRGEEPEEHGRHRGEQARGRAKDPVCGMTVETPKAKTSVYRRQTYYFCSNDCRKKFEATPASYAESETGGCG
jgi:Cu+-exporting ATPase